VEDILQRSMGPCKQAMTDANVTPTQIDEVVLVGGRPACRAYRRWSASCSPRIRTRREPGRSGGHRRGGAGGVLGGEVKDVLLLDVTRLSLVSRPWAASSPS